ncbi:hypothetical protein CAPTEDRAFT_170068 [Capitella teleta]|uniref:NadR/Ttd14 AAA domain-containing protein n=1 Tax=Capitella teleta TaxID=283909 RepID=R7TYY2_CAPTE|nr:hypothetical protein CAPTEDRAFT_170068 [Capitella teleta]|eukprot:ELT98807.1 hypothetical protein CAPTEDRAFT_170068 [Capitella teleta]
MSQKVGKNNNKVYRLVLTGGPCGGKTTGQSRLCTFFENLGWKVYRVPETATILMGGGVKWTDLNEDEAYRFQENLIKTMLQIENTFFDLAASCRKNCLVICDRGIMDASAYLKPEQWERMKKDNNWNEIDIRDSRYNQVLHLVSAANGAEAFYHTENHRTRHEGIDLAKRLDQLTSQAWVGHPYYDIIDNSTDFERKVVRMIAAACNRLGLEAGDRLSLDSHKRKFLVATLPDDLAYPQFQDFIVVHDYLVTPNQRMQARVRRRGQNGNWTYTHTIRRPEVNNESPELKMQISIREYELLMAQKDSHRYTVFKKRRCFLWNNQYFQMDIYEEPCHARCRGLIILETYTTLKGEDLKLPDFLNIVKEVTNDRQYSMYNLSRIDDEAQNSVREAKLAQIASIKEAAPAVNGFSDEVLTNGVDS